MSLQTWINEYMTCDLNKWIGLREENLKKHDCIKQDNIITNGFHNLRLTSKTCNLCKTTFDKNKQVDCKNCPLYIFKNSEMCDEEYFKWVEYGDPEPMIKLLEQIEEAKIPYSKSFIQSLPVRETKE